MFRDTIQKLTDNYIELGARRHSVRYNDHDFVLEVKARPAGRCTNDQAKTRAALNMEANIRKSAAGLGLGQYLSPEDVKTLQGGRVDLHAVVNGKSYSVPVDVSPDGQYSCQLLKSKSYSLRDMTAKIMDGIFEHNGIDNMYRQTAGMRNAIAQQVTAPSGGYGMRM